MVLCLFPLYKASLLGGAVKSSGGGVGGPWWFWLQSAFTSLPQAGEFGLKFMGLLGPEARAPEAELAFARQMPELFGVLFHFHG